MKKILVLMLVFGMASLANAGLTMTGDDLSTDWTGAGNGTNGVAAFVAIQGTTTSATMTMLYTGTLAEVVDYTAYTSLVAMAEGYIGSSIDYLYMIVFADGTGTPPSSDGLLGTWSGNNGDTIYQLDGTYLTIDAQHTFVPEPMTIGLLGLGGLFLRRRK